MATRKQAIAAKKLVENGGNVGDAMRKAGYSPATAKTPSKLTESKGFKAICEKAGLTSSLVIEALVEDIKAKKGQRVAELNIASKVLGLFPDKGELDYEHSAQLNVLGQDIRKILGGKK